MPQTTNKIELPVVDYDTAVMLKEVGWDIPVRNYIHPHYGVTEYNSPDNFNSERWAPGYYSAPELALVQVWAMQVYGLYISIMVNTNHKLFRYRISDLKNSIDDVHSTGVFDSHDSALQAAILYSLNKIKEQGK